MENQAKDTSSAGISTGQQQTNMSSSGSFTTSTISVHSIPDIKPVINTTSAVAVDTKADSELR